MKTEPFVWRNSQGLLLQPMLRDYLRWILPQIGRQYEPPEGVRDFTAAAVSRFDGKQPEPFRPRAAAGPVLRADMVKFAEYCFEAMSPLAEQNPYVLKRAGCVLVFVPEFKRLHGHLLELVRKKRQREG